MVMVDTLKSLDLKNNNISLNKLGAGDIILFRESRYGGHLYYSGIDSDEKYRWNCVMLSCAGIRHDYELEDDYIDRINKGRIPPYFFYELEEDHICYVASTLYFSYFQEAKVRLLGNCSDSNLINNIFFDNNLIECLPAVSAFIDIYNNCKDKSNITLDKVEIRR